MRPISELPVFESIKSKGGVGLSPRLVSLYATALLTLTGCEAKMFVIPGPTLETSKGAVQSCSFAISEASEVMGKKPWFVVPSSLEGVSVRALQPLPPVFDQKLSEEVALELLLDLRKNILQAHTAFLKDEGFSTSSFKVDESTISKRLELAIYQPMAEFIEKLSKYYPSLYACALNEKFTTEVYGFALKVIKDFAKQYGFIVDLDTLDRCDSGTVVPDLGFIVDKTLKTTVKETSEDIEFDETILSGKLSLLIEPIHTGVRHAKKLHSLVHAELQHLDLTPSQTWELVVHHGLSDGIANASVRGTTMTIENVDNPENFYETISHEYGHMLHAKLSEKMKVKRAAETHGASVAIEIDGLVVTDRRIGETVGVLFGLWASIHENTSTGFVSQLETIIAGDLEDYKLPRELLINQLEADSGNTREALRAALLKHPKEAAALIAKTYYTQGAQEYVVKSILKRLDTLTGKFLSKDWSQFVEQNKQAKQEVQQCD